MKKRTIYLTILTIVTIVCAIIGLLIHIVFPTGNWVRRFIDEDYNVSRFKDATTYEELDAFHNIDLDLRVSDVSIVYGKTYGINYTASEEKWIPTYEVKNDTLYVKQNVEKSSLKSVSNSCKIQITLPRDTSLSSIQGKNDVGDFDIENVSAFDINYDLSVGDIDMDNISFETATLTSSVGDIDIECSKSLKGYSMDLSCETNGNSNQKRAVATNTGDIEIDY